MQVLVDNDVIQQVMSTLQRVETRLQHVETRLQHVESTVLRLCNVMHHPATVLNQSPAIQCAAQTLEQLKAVPAGQRQ